MPSTDQFINESPSLESPATRLVSISPADADLPYVLRDIRVGSDGDVAVRDTKGNTVTFKNCIAGERIGPFRVDRVLATGTTAGFLIGYV